MSAAAKRLSIFTLRCSFGTRWKRGSLWSRAKRESVIWLMVSQKFYSAHGSHKGCVDEASGSAVATAEAHTQN